MSGPALTLEDALTQARARLPRPLSCLCPRSSAGTYHREDCIWGVLAVLIDAGTREREGRDKLTGLIEALRAIGKKLDDDDVFEIVDQLDMLANPIAVRDRANDEGSPR